MLYCTCSPITILKSTFEENTSDEQKFEQSKITRLDLAREIVSILPKKNLINLMNNLVQQNVEPSKTSEVVQFLEKAYSILLEEIALSLAKTFTSEELLEIKMFFSSSTGKQCFSCLPYIINESIQAALPKIKVEAKKVEIALNPIDEK